MKDVWGIRCLWAGGALIASHFVMGWLCLAAAASAAGPSAPAPSATASAPPDWVEARYDSLVPDLAAVLGLPTPRIDLRFDPTPAPSHLVLTAHVTADETIAVRLSGAGWHRRTPQTDRQIVANLAHELAHLWQRRLLPAPAEPRWIHEGGAEAIALSLLVDTGLWSEIDRRRADSALAERCSRALENGPLRPQFEGETADAAYGCGYVVVDWLAGRSGRSPRALYAELAATWPDPVALGTTLGAWLPAGDVATLNEFLTADWRGADPDTVVRSFRAGPSSGL
ncbi:hypothetical protein PB2503_02367 [Parvularcula bermudensis HTCC2503]|uniref:Peptidase M48 domain-containing protein n=1 Tax=Parvularcula bermudensis (strain ATCC BAA-594 / HTCC2503 / KCTC 12087) TaxID=314260 RepID=E0TCB8_PARBH|nr:hypothetical protein [Parvularcula bermudensis]ADM08551.1 hypothetical protein PB2503_02367 [Parvularcula bermudensis HTCC2503]